MPLNSILKQGVSYFEPSYILLCLFSILLYSKLSGHLELLKTPDLSSVCLLLSTGQPDSESMELSPSLQHAVLAHENTLIGHGDAPQVLLRTAP